MTTPSQALVPAAETEPSAPPRGTTAAGKARSAGRRTVNTASPKNGLRSELRAFVADHPGGWSHGDWLELLAALSARGYDTTDPEAIGTALERERLDLVLAGIPGLGDRRRTAILDRFARLWDLQRAGVDEIAGVPGLNAKIAKRICEALA